MCNNFGFIILELVLSAALFFGVVLSIIKMGNTGSKFERALWFLVGWSCLMSLIDLEFVFRQCGLV